MPAESLQEYLRVYDEGDVIFREGELGETVLLIKSGTVEVLKGSGPGQRSLATISDGEVVGEMALEEGEHERTATVKATEEVEGWRFPGPAFESLIDKDRTFRQKLFRSLLSRLADTTDRLTEQETSELRTLNRLLVEAAPVLLSDLDASALETDDPEKKAALELSEEFLAYHFDADYESVESLLSSDGQLDLEELDEDSREELYELARDVVGEVTDSLQLDVNADADFDEEFVEAAKTARRLLDKLEDHSETYENEQLQKVMEKRQDIQEIVEERKQNGRGGYLLSRIERMLSGIKQEINIRYD